MKIFTAAQIKEWDAYTIQHEPISSLALMERAAHACYEWIKLHLLTRESSEDKVAAAIKIFCGKGNNGGDGLAICRMLLAAGIDAKVFIAENGKTGTPDFEDNLLALRKITGDIFFLKGDEDLPVIKEKDIIIDALFGTGLNKPLEGLAASVVNHINNSRAKIISVDMPSGMFADKSSKGLITVRADIVLSFQSYKTSLLLPENEDKKGRVVILDIGLSPAFEEDEPALFQLLDDKMAGQIFKPRKQFAHKGNFGHALIVAGSYGKMGAAVLSSKACLRSGAGLLTTRIPVEGYEVMQSTVPEAMVITEKEPELSGYGVVGIGPGMGKEEDAVQLLFHIIKNFGKIKNSLIADACSLVIDADALNILAANPAMLKLLPPNTILTPHPKEFERLFGKTENDFLRLALALEKAAAHNIFIVLKGHKSLITTPDGRGFFNNTGNPGMATGGSGDVLTGIVTGLAAQPYTALEACLLAVYLHGLAGDEAAKAISQEAMIAGDIINSMGEAFKLIGIG
jgi:ADP-dependent NAD(P)H-hydrate dehydratase / NAD(P)H-hydrate epimerase